VKAPPAVLIPQAVMRGQKRVEDARERADARASIFFARVFAKGWIAGSSPAMTSLI
jgi:hypothetical protein